MEQDKVGIFKLGYIANLKVNEYGENCITALSKMVGKQITLEELNKFVDSDDCVIEYYDADNNEVSQENALSFRFKTPYRSKKKITFMAFLVEKA